MKSRFALLAMAMFFVLAVSGLAFCQPYIACDPQPEASVFRVRLSLDNGVTWGEWVEGPPVNSSMRFDVKPVAKGLYKGEAQAGADITLTDSQTGVVTVAREWSAGAFFILHKKHGKAPTTLRVLDEFAPL